MAEGINISYQPTVEEVSEIFKLASSHVREMKSLERDQMLLFYALYKQAVEGKCNTSKPPMWDFVGKAKWEAWKKLGDLSSIDAMKHYIFVLSDIDPDWDNSVEQGGNNSAAKSGGMGVSVSTMMRNHEEEVRKEDKSAFDWCKEGNLKELQSLLHIQNIDINAKDGEGMTLLHWAADRGHKHITDFLVHKNADLNAQDNEKQTPLHYAVVCEHSSIIQSLLEAGADSTILDADGQSPGDYAENDGIKKLLTARSK